MKAESQSHETYYTHIPDYAIDDDLATRWSAEDYIDQQWFQVDLGKVKTIKQVIPTLGTCVCCRLPDTKLQ